MIKQQHALNRTSPKGQDFIGTCINCGKENLTIDDQWSEECENVVGRTNDETLLAVLDQNE